MLTQVLASLAVILWGIVILQARSKLTRSIESVGTDAKEAKDIATKAAQDLKDTTSSLTGPPNSIIVNGQSIQAPLKYANLSALSNAIEGSEDGIKALVNWVRWRKEDDAISPPELTAHVSLIDDHTLEVSIAVAFTADALVTIANLNFGWLKQGVEWTGKEDGREIVRFGLFAGEREVDRTATFTQRFELERSFAQKKLPYPHLVGLSYTTHHIVWKFWECRV